MKESRAGFSMQRFRREGAVARTANDTGTLGFPSNVCIDRVVWASWMENEAEREPAREKSEINREEKNAVRAPVELAGGWKSETEA